MQNTDKKDKLSIVRTLIETALFLVTLVSYAFFRLDPIIRETVPYTYDQGRDFLKALDIVKNHNLTFIGPTTGINGLFHGAWWYYYLSIPYALFGANPISFYYTMFAVITVCTLLFVLFLLRKYGSVYALLFFAVIAFSPYFIPTAFQASNNFMVPPFLMLLIFAVYKLFETYHYKYAFLLSLVLGFILEFEVAFGLFIIPSAIVVLLFFIRNKKLYTPPNITAFVLGFVIPLLPRMLFELKNNFLQSKTIIGFFVNPSTTNPTPISTAVFDRASMFWGYYRGMFIDQNILPIFILIISIVSIAYGFRFLSKPKQNSFLFMLLLTTLLFLTSLAYRNNFFWANYYEGLPYFFLYLVLVSLYASLSRFNRSALLLLATIAVYIIAGLGTLYAYSVQPKNNSEGLIRTVKAIDYVIKKTNKKNYCQREYTPPVITHTYHYIEEFNEIKGKATKPNTEWVDNQCWFIIEKDPFTFRVEKWREENIPQSARQIEKYMMGDELSIELWELTK